MDGWTTIFETEQLYQAELVKNLLSDRGIEAVILNRKDSSFQFGWVDVMVKEEEQDKAIEILKSVNCE